MPDQPDQVRKKKQRCNPDGRQEIGRPEPLALRRERKTEQQTHDGKEDGVLVFEAQPCQHADGNPVAWIAAQDHARRSPQQPRPQKRLEGVHRQPVLQDQVDRNGSDGERRQRLGIAAAAPLPRNSGRHPDQNAARHGRQQAQGKQ